MHAAGEPLPGFRLEEGARHQPDFPLLGVDGLGFGRILIQLRVGFGQDGLAPAELDPVHRPIRLGRLQPGVAAPGLQQRPAGSGKDGFLQVSGRRGGVGRLLDTAQGQHRAHALLILP